MDEIQYGHTMKILLKLKGAILFCNNQKMRQLSFLISSNAIVLHTRRANFRVLFLYFFKLLMIPRSLLYVFTKQKWCLSILKKSHYRTGDRLSLFLLTQRKEPMNINIWLSAANNVIGVILQYQQDSILKSHVSRVSGAWNR